VVILDHKTASKRYPEDECEYSLELALYAKEEGINQVGYVVFDKEMRKRQPRARIQVIFGEITPRAIEVASEVQEQVQRAVDAKIFPCNFSQCNKQFGKPCEYKNLKWKGDMTGLIKLEKKK
jgi:hypothetical protein